MSARSRSPLPPELPPKPSRPCLPDDWREQHERQQQWMPVFVVVLCGIWLLFALATGGSGSDDPTVLCSRC